ncbi:MAG: type II toxin-antitoxin system RelE/ParE family toxin [Spirochaetales bacterium]|nr:type II toxin-antitoxin system RelE/ParE family toxin [Spirochaetales bacterium]
MIYNLKFLPTALKEWKKLDNSIQKQLKKKLKERLINPRVSGSELRGFKNYYKIKLRSSGYRLVYEVIDEEIYILVIVIGKRNRNEVYEQAKNRRK